MKTIDDFRSSKVLAGSENDLLMSADVKQGYVYDGCCFIEVMGDGSYGLIIGNAEYYDDDLASLEEVLYREWYVRECLP